MARRAQKRPCVSVVLAAHDAAEHIGRAVESVLNQRFSDLELILVDCGSHDRTRAQLDRFAERDIRVDVIGVAGESCLAGRRAGLDAAHGDYILFLNQRDWLSQAFLDVLVAAAEADGADLVIPELSIDIEQPDGARVSSTLAHGACFWGTSEEFRAASAPLIENGAIAFAAGKLIRRSLVEGLPSCAFDGDEQAFMVECVRGIERVAVVEGARYHLDLACGAGRESYEPGMFERCERDREGVMALYRDWGMSGDESVRRAIARRHLREVIRCIENASVGSGPASSADRRALVQRIVDAESTRESVRELKSLSHEFGIMYAPIARRSVTGCCMGARIQEIVGRALLPFAPAAVSARV